MIYSIINVATDEIIDIIDLNSDKEIDQFISKHPDVYLMESEDEGLEEWEEM